MMDPQWMVGGLLAYSTVVLALGFYLTMTDPDELPPLLRRWIRLADKEVAVFLSFFLVCATLAMQLNSIYWVILLPGTPDFLLGFSLLAGLWCIGLLLLFDFRDWAQNQVNKAHAYALLQGCISLLLPPLELLLSSAIITWHIDKPLQATTPVGCSSA